MTSSEKVAYIKGLMEGLAMDETSKETKVLKAIIDVLEDLALTVADLEDEVAVIDDDCSELYDIIDEITEEDDDIDEDDDFGFYDDEDICELICPECGNTVCVDGEDLYNGDAVCPCCGAEIQELDCDFDCENCGGCDSEEE